MVYPFYCMALFHSQARRHMVCIFLYIVSNDMYLISHTNVLPTIFFCSMAFQSLLISYVKINPLVKLYEYYLTRFTSFLNHSTTHVAPITTAEGDTYFGGKLRLTIACHSFAWNNSCSRLLPAKRSQNAEKVTHIKRRLLDQAMVLFNCVPFENGNFS